jgi:CBS domain-containing protein
MKKREPVSHIMTKNVATINETDDLRKALKIVKEANIRHLPVVNGNQVTGIISSTDLNRLTFGGLFDNQETADEAVLDMLSIPQVMSANPTTVSSDTPIKDVAEIFTSESFHALPVVENGELAGIVTTTDMINYLKDMY